MPSGRASWTTGSSMTSPPLPTSCAPPAAPPRSAWAPVRRGGSGSSTQSASHSGRPFPSLPVTSGMTSTLTWMPGATNSNASRRKGSEHHGPCTTLPRPQTAQPLSSFCLVLHPWTKGGGNLLAHSCWVMPLMLSRSYSWTTTSTPALARGRAGGISLKAVDLLEKVLFLFCVFLWGEGFFS